LPEVQVLHTYGVRIFNIDGKTGVVLDAPLFSLIRSWY